jgi:hypothetical protein
MPSRIIVMAGRCAPEALDIAAFADALRVELVQRGVHAVDVVESDSIIPVDPNLLTLTVDASCDAGPRILIFELHDAATSMSTTPILPLEDVEPKVRPRAAALFIAERLRAAWPELSALSPTTAPDPRESTESPPGPVMAARTPVQEGHEVPSPPLFHTTAMPAWPSPPLSPMTDATGLIAAAAVEWRLFSGPGSAALLGPRLLILAPGLRSVPLRLHFDVGAAFGSVRDSLGDISLSIASTGIGLAVVGHPGPFRLELGPKLEMGWTAARGIPRSTTASGSSANTILATASVFASAWTVLARDWYGMFAIDVGATLAGLDARADERPVAEVRGAMLGARIGVGRAF